MRIENIGPDDIQVGDVIGGWAIVSDIVDATRVLCHSGDGFALFCWVEDAWRRDGAPGGVERTAYRDVPDKWERRQGNFVAPRDGDWAFVVDYHIGLDGTRNQGWVEGVVAQTTQWLTDRLNEGHFGEMPSRKAV